MKIIEPYFVIESEIDGKKILELIERSGRTCYKSEDKITEGSARKFVQMIIGLGHESVLEHQSVSVRIICDRGVTHELVRHRLCAYSQESTRYCDYSKDKFDGGNIIFIKPCFWDYASPFFREWKSTMDICERSYKTLIANGATPQQARSVLPNSLKTEIVVTANLREWRHILRLRTSVAAHPQMRQIMIPLLKKFQGLIPVVFDGIKTERGKKCVIIRRLFRNQNRRRAPKK